MRCNQHRRDQTTTCMWCGKKLCPECVGKQEGKKTYCEKCVASLAPFEQKEQRKVLEPHMVHKDEELWTSKN